MALIDEMSALLNKHSAENESDTPDYLLAGFLMQCLSAWNSITRQREMWHGRVLAKDQPNKCGKCGEDMLDYDAIYDSDDADPEVDVPDYAKCKWCGELHHIEES